MKISDIYDTALYLAEKTDDNTGYIDSEYKNQHKMKALEIIKQCIIRLSGYENMPVVNVANLKLEDEAIIPLYMAKTIVPSYLAAILCHQDGEENKYNVLICEYQRAVESIKHGEETPDYSEVTEGLR